MILEGERHCNTPIFKILSELMRALLIGCGNIGALYDWNQREISTYAKALHACDFDFSVYDTNRESAAMVANRYGVKSLRTWNETAIKNYDLVIISSSTETHAEYLRSLLVDPPRLIVCEKPVDVNLNRLEDIEAIYKRGSVRVVVNYHRHFQPKIMELSKRVRELAAASACSAIIVTYQRGFHNNASHAIDLLEVLFGEIFTPDEVCVTNSTADEFPSDPTVTMTCMWNGVQVLFIGLAFVKFSHFEVSLTFKNNIINIRNAGDLVEFFSAPELFDRFYPKLELVEIWRDVLQDHMINFIQHLKAMLNNQNIPDNFLQSINISKTVISIIKKEAYD